MIVIFIILSFNSLLIIASDLKLHTDDGDYKCISKLRSCKLTIDGQPFGEPGPKGDSGTDGRTGLPGPPGRGLKGPKGEKGQNGDSGLPGDSGPIGPPGRPGYPGDSGMKGDKGRKGDKGTKGEMGLTGLTGLTGLPGQKGDMGLQGIPGYGGIPGPHGPPGLPGLPGTCGCIYSTPDLDYTMEDSSDKEFGTEKEPALLTCKFAPTNVKSGVYYLGPYSQAMKVHCNMTTRETCLHSTIKSENILYSGMTLNDNEHTNYRRKESAFWLSGIMDLMNIYNLTQEQITWLQARSSSVTQTIRYHCRNSVPYSATDMSSSVNLLTWNDVVIGPYSSDTTPFTYSVPEKTHNCFKDLESEQYSDIVLRSNNVYRLPIRDIQIRDVRDELQMFYLESVELCFA